MTAAESASAPAAIAFVAVRHDEMATGGFRPIREVAVVRLDAAGRLDQVCSVVLGTTPNVYATYRDADGAIAAVGPHPRSRTDAVKQVLATTQDAMLAAWDVPRVLDDVELLLFDEGLRWRDGLPRLLDVPAAVWATLGRLPESPIALAAELGMEAPTVSALSHAWWLSRVGLRLREAQDLAARVARFAGDETSIARKVIDRLESGHKQYGPWRVDDGRDYRGETIDELVDGAHYLAAEVVRLERALAAALRRGRRPIILCLHRDPRLLDPIAAQVLAEGAMPVLAQRVVDQFVKDGVPVPRAIRTLVDTCDEVRVYGGAAVPELGEITTLAIACGKRVRYVEGAKP